LISKEIPAAGFYYFYLIIWKRSQLLDICLFKKFLPKVCVFFYLEIVERKLLGKKSGSDDFEILLTQKPTKKR